MRSTKKHSVLSLRVRSRSVKNGYFHSFCAVSQTEPPKLENLNWTQLELHQVWGNLHILLFLKVSPTCWVILDSSFFPASDSGPDSFTETLARAPGSCQAPGKSQMTPLTTLQDRIRIALLSLSVKQLFNLKLSNYLYTVTRHTRQRKTIMCAQTTR